MALDGGALAISPAPLRWQLADVVELRRETARVRSILLALPGWAGHRAGQHIDLRLTADDGYQAQRSYSLASAPEDDLLLLTVERLEDGEVSPYLVDELRVGDRLELRGPIGGHFVWHEALGGPLLLLAGGSGIAPLRAILRHRAARGSAVPARLLYSSRSLEEVIYRDELDAAATDASLEIELRLTRRWPEGWRGGRGRIDDEHLRAFAWTAPQRPLVYICGPNGFVEAAADGLVRLGHDPGRIHTERFGPSG